MRNTENRHFEEWVTHYRKSLCAEHQESVGLLEIVRAYTSLYPGRVDRLIAEMVQTIRDGETDGDGADHQGW